jgi:hypothetical protein
MTPIKTLQEYLMIAKRAILSWQACVALLFATFAWGAQAAQPASQKTFASPDAAVAALIEAARKNDKTALNTLFGPAGKGLGSGDAVQEKGERARFVAAYDEKHELKVDGGARATLVIGKDDWPFPVPLVKAGEVWKFDATSGKEELLNRRIGRNELQTIQVLLAITDAQREYAAVDQDGDGVREYAQKFRSSGKHDGLYWPAKAGEPQSPLGTLAAGAVREGYSAKGKEGKPVPYWGYYFRILKGQGKDAPGGKYSYMAGRNLIGGFAVVAYPAEYMSSGVKSFMVNHDGVVYEKDLGPKTPRLAAAMTEFNPGEGWAKASAESK